jgi:aspartate dehydrogenase
MRVGLLGGGTIARTIAEAANNRHIESVEFVGVAGKSNPPSRRVTETARLLGVPVLSRADLLERRPEWVLEAAGVGAAKNLLPDLLERHVGVILMSAGALADPALLDAVNAYRRNGGRVIVPCGAIGGLDAVRALNATGGLHKVTITSTKAPAGLSGAPYLEEHGIVLPTDRTVTVFDGTARDAIAAFPANVNVAVALSLAGVGVDQTRVVIRSDPGAPQTTHAIRAEGEAADLEITLSTRPHPSNPRTSWLAALSALATLRQVSQENTL